MAFLKLTLVFLTPYIIGFIIITQQSEDNKMTRTFIEVPLFTKRWNEIGLGETELTQLQIMLLKDPAESEKYVSPLKTGENAEASVSAIRILQIMKSFT